MDLGKMFSDIVGGAAAFFFGAPAHAETPVVSPPRISPVQSDWKQDVPDYAQCAVNVARNFMSPNDPNAVSISSSHQDGVQSVWLATYGKAQYEEIAFAWGATKDGTQTKPGWEMQHSWDKTSHGKVMTGYYETGDVSGYLGGPVGGLFNAEASRMTYTLADDKRLLQDVKPVAVPHIYNAIKTTCNPLG